MKTKHIVLTLLGCFIILAVVGVWHSSFKGRAKRQEDITAEPKNVLVELKTLTEEVSNLKAEINALKLGEKDYTKEIQEMVEKRAQQPLAKQASSKLNAGIISIRRIFQESKKGISYKKEAMAEQDRIVAELDKLSREIEADKAGLRTLKENSSDYMEATKRLFEKQANYQARSEFYKQQMEMKDQLWTKELYQDILRIAGEVAKEKGLDLVFKEDEVDFSETDISELGLSIRTQKLLYSGGCLDITDEVRTRLDAEK